MVEAILLDKGSLLAQWCDGQKIRNLIQQNRAGAMAAEHHLYKLLSTQLWLQGCLGARNH